MKPTASASWQRSPPTPGPTRSSCSAPARTPRGRSTGSPRPRPKRRHSIPTHVRKKLMGTTPTEVMAFPNGRAIVRDHGTAEVIVAGNSRIVPAGNSVQELRNNALALIVGEAQTLQRPVRVRIEDPEGHGELIVHPDNKIESVSYEPAPARRRAEAPETTPAPETAAAPATAASVDAQPWPTAPATAAPEPQTAAVVEE